MDRTELPFFRSWLTGVLLIKTLLAARWPRTVRGADASCSGSSSLRDAGRGVCRLDPAADCTFSGAFAAGWVSL